MKKNCKLLTAFFVLSLSFIMCRIQGMAAEERTYSVTLYAGNHGRFSDTSFVSVAGDGVKAVVCTDENGSFVKVSGLKKGEVVVFDSAAEGAVNMEGNSKYYIKGIRRSGRDNSAVDTSAVLADADRDYVIAYAVRGDMVSYEVRYEDKAGRALAQSRTYYGNIGDRPVPAFIYIPGYVPQAYNLTKTLSQNTAENVFTFVYSRLPSPGQGGGGQETGTGSKDTEEVERGYMENAEEAAAQEIRRAEAAVSTGGRTEPAAEEAGALSGQEEEAVIIPEGDTPRQLVGLDDEEVPRAESGDKLRDTAFFENLLVVALAIPALSIACLILWLKKTGRKKEEDE